MQAPYQCDGPVRETKMASLLGRGPSYGGGGCTVSARLGPEAVSIPRCCEQGHEKTGRSVFAQRSSAPTGMKTMLPLACPVPA